MNSETIKDFLVSLGFEIDEAGARKFDSVLAGTTLNAIKMGLAIEGAALSVLAYTAKIAAGLDQLYWASQRTGATVQGIKAIGYAVSQVGGSAEAAQGSLESLARFVRNTPGAEGFLNRLGVQTRDASGNMQDMATIFTGVGQTLSSMPYYRANLYAQMLGMDENTLMAMRRGVGGFAGQYTAMAKAIGVNSDDAAKSANRFMTSLGAFSAMAGMARDKIGSNLAGGLAGSLDTLRRHILDNFPRIEQTLTKTIKGVLTLGDTLGRLFFRLIQGASDLVDWWNSLDKQTRELTVLLGALTVALRMLNSAFWMSPIGRVTLLAAGLALLWEDYKTWKEGGQSLVDWGKWKPEIDAALKAMDELKASIKGVGKEIASLLNIDLKNWSLKGDIENLTKQFGEFGKMMSMIGDLINALKEGNWSEAGKIGKALLNQGSDQPDALPEVSAAAVRHRKAALGLYYDANNKLNEYLPGWLGGNGWSIHGSRPGGKDIYGGVSLRGVLDVPKDTLERSMGTLNVEQHAQSARRTLADRNNNPGNIRPVGGKGFRFFESALHGWEAMKNQLMRYFTGKTTGRQLQTIWDIVSTWAPAGDNNDPEKYAQDVAKWMGVSPNAALNLTNPDTMASLMQSMARKEGYSDWNSPLAHRAAGGVGGGTQLQQQNTYNIYGGDVRQIGSEVERRQHSANAQVMRGNQAKVG